MPLRELVARRRPFPRVLLIKTQTFLAFKLAAEASTRPAPAKTLHAEGIAPSLLKIRNFNDRLLHHGPPRGYGSLLIWT